VVVATGTIKRQAKIFGLSFFLQASEQNRIFCNGCAEEIEKVGNHHQMSEKCIMILRDIFCKHHGRRGSKKYLEAEKIFDTSLDTNIVDTMIGLGK
jgi:hypothetical protein